MIDRGRRGLSVRRQCEPLDLSHASVYRPHFDAMCLTPVETLTPAQIRRIRLREKASQAVFALHLNVTTGLVSQWERGEKRPRGASLKLLNLVARKGLASVA